jgi:hypothetical protein
MCRRLMCLNANHVVDKQNTFEMRSFAACCAHLLSAITPDRNDITFLYSNLYTRLHCSMPACSN